jgi:hypothetical protein
MKQHSQRHDSTGNGPARDLRKLHDLPVTVATKYRDWRPGWLEPNPRAAPHEPTSTAPGLSNEEMRFLKVVMDNPLKPSSAYPKLVRVSPRKAIEIRRRLVELGLLREIKVNTKPRGRASTLIEATQRAVELL